MINALHTGNYISTLQIWSVEFLFVVYVVAVR